MTSPTLSTRPSPSPRMCAVSGRPYFPSGRSIAAYSEKLLKHSGMYMMPQETPGAPSESASSTSASACSSSAAVNGVREKPLRLMRTAPVPIIAAKFSGSAAFSSRRTYSRYVSGAPAGTGPSTAAENARCSAQNGAAHGVSEMPQLPETDVVMPCRSSASALQPERLHVGVAVDVDETGAEHFARGLEHRRARRRGQARADRLDCLPLHEHVAQKRRAAPAVINLRAAYQNHHAGASFPPPA